MRRWALRIGGALLLLGLAFLGWTYWQATRPPIVRHGAVTVADWPAGEPSRTVLLISDTHVAGPDMPPARLARLLEDLNALKPDLILLAGDYISEKKVATRFYSADESVAPLARLTAPLGVFAVLGNHDYWADGPAFRAAFARHRIPLLINSAVRRGPFVIGGVDDATTRHADVRATQAAMAALGPGARILLAHSPEIEDRIAAPVDALLAGHTHCGQLRLPGLVFPSIFRPCGAQRTAGGAPRFVTAGIGTSVLPLRFAAPADVWLIRFSPPASRTR